MSALVIEKWEEYWSKTPEQERIIRTPKDFQQVLRLASPFPLTVTRTVFRLLDSSGDRCIQPDEFGEFFKKLEGTDVNDKYAIYHVLYKLLDQDGNGVLDAQELSLFAKAIGAKGWNEDRFQFELDKEHLSGWEFGTFRRWCRRHHVDRGGERSESVMGVPLIWSAELTALMVHHFEKYWVEVRKINRQDFWNIQSSAELKEVLTWHSLFELSLTEACYQLVANNDGVIRLAEFKGCFAKLVGVDIHDPLAIRHVLFKLVDQDGNDALDAGELEKLAKAVKKPKSKSEFQALLTKEKLKGWSFERFNTWWKETGL
jgi:Ca2+-binding EF-hand superfamily protein